MKSGHGAPWLDSYGFLLKSKEGLAGLAGLADWAGWAGWTYLEIIGISQQKLLVMAQ
jgi:hypothetical protein